MSLSSDPLSSHGTHSDIAIQVRDLTVGFGSKIILEHLDLDVRRGEVLGFVGGSGSGKSVLTRAILRLVQPRFLAASSKTIRAAICARLNSAMVFCFSMALCSLG